jgi:integrase
MTEMPKPLPPHLNRQPGRHGNGKVYWYVRLGKGPRIPIREEYGTAAFWEAYRAALAGGGGSSPPPSRASRGTLRWAADLWKRSSDWSSTSPATQKQRDNILTRVLQTAGDHALEEIDAAAIRAGREKRQATPAAANNFLKTMRALFRWAKEEQLVDADPAREVKFLRVKTKGFLPWTMAEVDAYRAHWPLGTTQRLALELFINTGFRRGDAAAVGRQHVRDGVIQIRTGKTDTPLYIPILPALADAIDAGPIGEMSFLVTKYRRPFTKESLGNLFREWCDAAGVSKSAHGIRKLAATVIADAGGSEQELQALFGWTTNAMSGLYTREANRKRQALQASFKLLEELERNTDRSPNPRATAQLINGSS